jgi:hypothetical protein
MFVDEDGNKTPVTNIADIPPEFGAVSDGTGSEENGLWHLHFPWCNDDTTVLYFMTYRFVYNDNEMEIEIESSI